VPNPTSRSGSPTSVNPTAWVSRLGDDALGRRIHRALAAEGVDTSGVINDPDRPTGLFLKDVQGGPRPVTYYRSGSAASTMDRANLDRASARAGRLLHLSGVTPALSSSCLDAITHTLTRPRSKPPIISFDVNYRAAALARPADGGDVPTHHGHSRRHRPCRAR
jgi:2-dehydro-3-deoxygluconokinase